MKSFRKLESKNLTSLIGRLNSTTQPNHINLLALNAVFHLVEHGNNAPLNRLNKAVKGLKMAAVYNRWLKSLQLPVRRASDGHLSLDKEKLKSFSLNNLKSFTSFIASEENKKIDSAIKAELLKADLAAANSAANAAELSGDKKALEAAKAAATHLEKQAVKPIGLTTIQNQLKRALASYKAHGLSGTSAQLAQLADLAADLAAAAKAAAYTQQGVEASQVDSEAVNRLAKSGQSKKNARVS